MPTMLPSVPKSLGRLSDVLTSAAAATEGQPNALQLSAVESGIVILVDGLGWHNLRTAGGHSRFLNSLAEGSKATNTVLPSTTAAALTSLATGLQPNQHGIIGYRVLDRSSGSDKNLLSGWTSFDESSGWRVGETLSESRQRAGASTHFVGPAAYAKSGFTNVIMPSATYVAADRIADRFKSARELLRVGPTLVYLYVPELDQTAHAFGAASSRWLMLIEELDGLVREFAAGIPRGVGVILTADHGIVDVSSSAHIHLERAGISGIRHYGGDTRCGFMYLEDASTIADARAKLTDFCGSAVTIAPPSELIEAGWMKPYAEAAARLVPDLVLLANKDVAIYHREFSSGKSYSMVGHHGSWSATELQIPLLKFGAWT